MRSVTATPPPGPSRDLSDQVPKGQCRGIGFGCQPSPAEDAQLMLLFFALPIAILQIALGCGVLALLRLWKAYRTLPVLVQGLIPCTPMIVLAIAILVYY